jgi:hypothetical protein
MTSASSRESVSGDISKLEFQKYFSYERVVAGKVGTNALRLCSFENERTLHVDVEEVRKKNPRMVGCCFSPFFVVGAAGFDVVVLRLLWSEFLGACLRAECGCGTSPNGVVSWSGRQRLFCSRETTTTTTTNQNTREREREVV